MAQQPQQEARHALPMSTIPKEAGGKSYRERFSAHLKTKVAVGLFLEVELMMLALATGIIDAITYINFRVFAANQTGNSVLLAVGALSDGNGYVNLKFVGVSLGSFLGGGIIIGQLGNYVGSEKRYWLLLTNFFQTALVFGAAGIKSHTDAAGDADDSYSMGIIALLAVSSAAQIGFARAVHIAEIPTAVVTSAYIDMLIDTRITKRHNRPRNRRFFFVLSLVVGSFIGAIVHRYDSSALALYLAGIVKALVCVAVLFNPSVKEATSGV